MSAAFRQENGELWRRIPEKGVEILVPQFEYRVEHLIVGAEGYAGLAETLKQFSALGWRLVAVSNGIHYFEREL